MPCYEHKFEVVGTGPFPLDMLRVDCCFPETTRDTGTVQTSFTISSTEQYSVHLVSIQPLKNWQPATNRWRSHGFTITSYSQLMREGAFPLTPPPASSSTPVRPRYKPTGEH